jgi:large subunit ribosomal protein L28
MARVCSKTGKRGSVGNRRSHSLRATKRRFNANIQKKRVFDPATGKFVRIKVSTSYLRTLAKQLQKG